jgi:putative hydrolase of the HAD superfamily
MAISGILGRKPSALLFDLDDTLYDRELVFHDWAKEYISGALDIADTAERERILKKILALDTTGYGSQKAALVEVSRMFPPAGASETPEEAGTRIYESLVARISLPPTSVRLLQFLAEIGMPFGVVTNGTPRQWDKLVQLGVSDRSSCLFVSSTFGEEKPAPAIFHAAARCLALPESEILFVGDHPINDIFGASRAGMQTAWVCRGLPWPDTPDLAKPDLVLDQIGELEGILRGL